MAKINHFFEAFKGNSKLSVWLVNTHFHLKIQSGMGKNNKFYIIYLSNSRFKWWFILPSSIPHLLMKQEVSFTQKEFYFH